MFSLSLRFSISLYLSSSTCREETPPTYEYYMNIMCENSCKEDHAWNINTPWRRLQHQKQNLWGLWVWEPQLWETERESGIIITKSTTWTGYTVFHSSHMLNLKAAWFSAQSHLAASSCRRPRPTRLLSSGGPGCCSCSHGAPGAPCAPAGRAAAGCPSPAVGLLPGSHSAPPQTLLAGLGSPAWLLSAVTTGRRFTDEKLRHGNLDFTLFRQISADIVRFLWTFKH